MGCGSSSAKGTKEEIMMNRMIEKQLREDRRKMDNEVKLLLLGAGESGKSTIAKQMKIIHLQGFTDKEKVAFKKVIHTNVVTSIKTLVEAAEVLGIPISQQNIPVAQQVMAINVEAEEITFDNKPVSVYPFNRQIGAWIKQLWADPGVQRAYSRASEFQLNDSTSYFLDSIDRLVNDSYIPDDQDMLRARVKTTSVLETEFDVQNTHFRMVDVGGQRGERSKWIGCFQDVTAVIFCVAMSEYDLKLVEDESVNRMHESMTLFDQVCNNKWFAQTAMILFLNKRDIFEAKIKRVDLRICFDDYTGGNDYNKGAAFIKQKFVGLNRSPGKDIYTHITCATDTGNIRVVFNAVRDIILKKTINEFGL